MVLYNTIVLHSRVYVILWYYIPLEFLEVTLLLYHISII